MVVDKDIVKSSILMNCGCLLSHNHYFNSGIQQDNAVEHLKARYDFDMQNETIRDFHDNIQKLLKLMTSLNVERLCYWHTQELLSNIVHNAKQHFDNNNKNNNKKRKKI